MGGLLMFRGCLITCILPAWDFQPSHSFLSVVPSSVTPISVVLSSCRSFPCRPLLSVALPPQSFLPPSESILLNRTFSISPSRWVVPTSQSHLPLLCSSPCRIRLSPRPCLPQPRIPPTTPPLSRTFLLRHITIAPSSLPTRNTHTYPPRPRKPHLKRPTPHRDSRLGRLKARGNERGHV